MGFLPDDSRKGAGGNNMRYVHVPCKFGFIKRSKFYFNLNNTMHSL